MIKRHGFIVVFLLLFVLFLTPANVFAESKPVVTIKDMELSPYEGYPVEIVVEATGTNLSYQWQICYGDVLQWGDNVDLDDNERYQGTKTPHFKLYTYFGDEFDEELDFCKIRCKVEGDGGTSYSQEVWFGIKERKIVDDCFLTGVAKPAYGQKPDYAFKSDEKDKYVITDVNWFGPKLESGTYHKMKEDDTFEEGNYYCRIDISVKDAYKFADDAIAYIDGREVQWEVVSGKGKNPLTYDTYYAIQRFTIKKEIIPKVEITDLKMPIGGEKIDDASYAAAKVPENALYNVKSVNWYEEDWSVPEGNVFVTGTKYRLNVVLSPKAGYCFDLDDTLVVMNGRLGTVNRILENDDAYMVCFATAAEPKNHTPELRNERDATCTTDGYTGDLVCTNCNEIVQKGDVIKAKGHIWTSWKVVNEPTYEAEGKEERSCQACSHKEERVIDKLIDKPVENPFVDVYKTDYYYDAVLWALQNNVTAGLDATHFAPSNACTRGQVVTFLWRSQGSPKPVTTKNPFVDVQAGLYYSDAILWAYENNITAGLDATHFAPEETVTRGQFVTFLHRLEGKPSYTVSNPFTDVAPGLYYTDAILWALENGITAGLTPTQFGPEEFCTRGQVVTFLYRAYKFAFPF